MRVGLERRSDVAQACATARRCLDRGRWQAAESRGRVTHPRHNQIRYNPSMMSDSPDFESMRRKVPPITSSADPTLSSVVGPRDREGVRQIGTWNLVGSQIIEDQFGRKYYEITSNASDQMFLAKLLKGVLPTSDIIYIKESSSNTDQLNSKEGRFFSYEMPLDKMKRPPEAPKTLRFEAQAYRLLLAHVFSDYDRKVWGKTGMHNGRISDTGITLHDFADFANKFSYTESETERDERRNVDWSEWVAYCGNEWEDTRNFLRHKCTELKNRLEGEQGLSFMKAVITNMQTQKVPLPTVLGDATSNESLFKFQEEVLLRISLLQESLATV